MILSALIRKRDARNLATAISAISATQPEGEAATVARIATVAVANLKVEKVALPANDPTSRYWMWLIHFADAEPRTCTFSPEVSHGEVLAQFPDAVTAEPVVNSTSDALPALTAQEEAAIRAWLARIEETDPATIAEVIGHCQRDADVRDYFTERAALALPRSACFPDDRRTCSQCANLIARRCQAAKRGEIVANRNYEPICDLPRRCESYVPGAGDPDSRHGPERWSGVNRPHTRL